MQNYPARIRREAFFKTSWPPQLFGCFSCSLFSLHSHSPRPSLIPYAQSPLPLNRRKHQSAKNTEIAKCNFSPEMTNLLQFIFPNRSCSSEAVPRQVPSPSSFPHLHNIPTPPTHAEEGPPPFPSRGWGAKGRGVKARAGDRKENQVPGPSRFTHLHLFSQGQTEYPTMSSETG